MHSRPVVGGHPSPAVGGGTRPASLAGELILGHILDAAGLDDSQVLVLRHTYTPDGLAAPGDATPANLLPYVRQQELGNKVGRVPPFVWLNFMADGGRRSRCLGAYENHGEVPEERTSVRRYFDLRPSDSLVAMKGRLVVKWSRDAVNWAKSGASASLFPVVEVADPVEVPFPGFDKLRISYDELTTVVEDSRYAHWRSALSAVQGIYLIGDTSTGRLYVGKADGGERILGRWMAYVRDGHGGNVALRQVAGLDPAHARHFKFSLLQVFGPATTSREIDAAESHFKDALLTRVHGLNRN